MCCSYCFGFEECKKIRKTNPNCCFDCAEYEFCPFIIGKKDKNNSNSDFTEHDTSTDIDMLDGDIF